MHLLKKISVLAILVLIMSSCAEEYSLKNYGKMRVLYYSDYTVNFFIEAADIKIKTDNEVVYSYFQGDRILRTQGDYDGRLLGGEYKELYLDKSLKERGTYKNGVKDGEWKTWNTEGKLIEVINWKEGKLHGKHLKYYKGQLGHEIEYKNNELVEGKKEKEKLETKEKEVKEDPKENKKEETEPKK